MKVHKPLVFVLSSLVLAHPIIVEHIEIPHRQIQTHDDQVHALHPRDSITIEIKSSFPNYTVSNIQNNVKGSFEVVNNAKNANIAMGDNSNHTADLHSFGDKNMLNSTGSNTGGWNTKNQGSNLTTGRMEKRSNEQITFPSEGEKDPLEGQHYGISGARQTKDDYRWDGNMPGRAGTEKHRSAAFCEPTDHVYLAEQCVPSSSRTSKTGYSAWGKRDQVNLNVVGGNSKASNMTRSGNRNAVEVYITGGEDNIVNITISHEADSSALEDSNNENAENAVKIYVGGVEQVKIDDSDVPMAGGKNAGHVANARSS
ncbi:hypothetical protein V8E51_015253 [Hyaloscypha variabilis]